LCGENYYWQGQPQIDDRATRAAEMAITVLLIGLGAARSSSCRRRGARTGLQYARVQIGERRVAAVLRYSS
jgi:hypothetical protein